MLDVHTNVRMHVRVSEVGWGECECDAGAALSATHVQSERVTSVRVA